MMQDPVPYDSPNQAPAYSCDPLVTARVAPKSLRLANVLIDSLIWGWGFGSFKLLLAHQIAAGGGEAAFLTTFNPLWVALEAFVYYMVFETVFGWTPGKWVTGTRVLRCDGSKPSAGDIARRTLIRLIPVNALSFLFGEPSGWHDVWTDTRVVRSVFSALDELFCL